MVLGKPHVRNIVCTTAACALSLAAITTMRLAGASGDAEPRSLPTNELITVRTQPSKAPAASATPDAVRVRPSGADLPDGPPVPTLGYGTWHVVPGGGATGNAAAHTFTVEVEDGVRTAEGDAAFGTVVQQVLDDPRGWTAGGATAFRRIDAGEPDLRVRLTAQRTARELCGFELPFDTSCRIGGVVHLSAARWTRGATAFDDLADYRRYMVNHEVGHFLGHPHEPCDAHGSPAPVMMQQTFSTANDELTRITGGNAEQADGKVCTANPWPHP
ncbi:DUF3152 domain-containing protein [Umezawaea sp.]|uniref:DUF3152 domain-containing protein n=1 Tax=Umezawaea sp. TaxID=1955258 RepID=UPI002ED518C7